MGFDPVMVNSVTDWILTSTGSLHSPEAVVNSESLKKLSQQELGDGDAP